MSTPLTPGDKSGGVAGTAPGGMRKGSRSNVNMQEASLRLFLVTPTIAWHCVKSCSFKEITMV